MPYADPRRARLYPLVRLGRIIPPGPVRMLARIALALGLILLAGWLFGIAPQADWHFGILALIVAYLAELYTLFFERSRAAFAPPEGAENLADYLDYGALSVASRYGGGALETLLLPMLEREGMPFVLSRIGMSPKTFRAAVAGYLSRAQSANADLASFLQACLDDRAAQKRAPMLSWRDLFAGLARTSPFLSQLLIDLKLEASDLESVLGWEAEIEALRERRRRYWSRENLMRTKSLGQSWSSGYTPRLEHYAVEVNRYAGEGYAPHLYGRMRETEEIERVLARDGRNNVVLVGQEGVGKSVAVSALAERIALGDVLGAIAHKRVLELRVATLIAGAEPGEVEARFESVLGEAVRAGNVILLIDDIHTLFDPSGAPGTIDATKLLLPFLSSARLQVIGLTTFEGYHAAIVKHPDLLRLFEKVEIAEPAREDVYAILRDVVPQIEAHDGVWFLFQAIKAAVTLSDRYIKNAPFPEKAIGLLQEAAVFAQTKSASSVVSASDVEAVVGQKTNVPVGDVAQGECEILLNLEAKLHARVVGQDEAIAAIASAMRRARSGLSSGKRPIGSFLFLGPTGVGKTETAKALADAYFGSEKRMLRFDMSEYQQPDSVNRLIGQGDEPGALTTAILDYPFSLILLDELEKAHRDVLNIFLQVLDDGRLTDALGRTADFTNAIIIATSNAGAELIREAVAAGGADARLKDRVLESLQSTGVFKPEFLNRFDGIIMFKPLSQAQTTDVARLMLDDLNARLKEKAVTVAATPEALEKLVALGFDQEFGARPLRRVVQDKVENLVAEKLLSGALRRGDTLTLTPEDLG